MAGKPVHMKERRRRHSRSDPTSIRVTRAGRAPKGLQSYQALLGLLVLGLGWYLTGNWLRDIQHKLGISGDGHQKCSHGHWTSKDDTSVVCPVQPDVRDVGPDWNPAASKDDSTAAYERLVGAIRIRTETFDDMPMLANSSEFDVFHDFEAYLLKTFPIL